MFIVKKLYYKYNFLWLFILMFRLTLQGLLNGLVVPPYVMMLMDFKLGILVLKWSATASCHYYY